MVKRVVVSMVLLAAAAALVPDRPIVIAHRGASGHQPEHTLEAYKLAIEMGADYIEPDLVATKDGVLITRHENELSETTNVADRFPDRKRTRTIGGRSVTGWFSEDLTLSEIKTLRARERLASRTHVYDDQLTIPTFDDVLALAIAAGRERGRDVGIYPETKHPSYFQQIGLPLEERLLASLRAHGWNHKDAPVFIQSLEPESLRQLRQKTSVRLVQLTSDAKMVDDAGLVAIAAYADGIGVEKQLIQPVGADGALGPPTDLVARAHAQRLFVHVWTLRADKEFLPAAYRGDATAEFHKFRELGVDGVFSDFPDIGVKAYGRTGR